MARLLVVEDDAHVLDLLRRCLVELGHKVATAVDGVFAYDAVVNAAHEFDVILCNIAMPRLDGPGFVRKALPWVQDRTPTIFMSGLPETADAAVEEFGGYAIAYPLELELLWTALDLALDDRRAILHGKGGH